MSAARHFVKSQLAIDEELAETAELLVSELAANVVRHAGTNFEVEVTLGDDRVWVAVEDGSAVEIAVRDLVRDADSGRGLRIVERLATRWGTTSTASGKKVWFELSLGRPPGPNV